MHITIVFAILLVTSLHEACCRRRIRSYSDAANCHLRCPLDYDDTQFNCKCEDENWRAQKAECVPIKWLCDGHPDCDNEADEMDCICPPGQLQCGSDIGGDVEDWQDQYNCINEELVGNWVWDCYNVADEKYTSLCGDAKGRCDGRIDCRNTGVDEKNCACPRYFPNQCDCSKPDIDKYTCKGNGNVCYFDGARCNARIDCPDASDEDGCSCGDDQFTCHCYKTSPPSCSYFERGCIPMSKYLDGWEDCEDGSDERELYRRNDCDECVVEVRRLASENECDDYQLCDRETCVHTPSMNCSDFSECNQSDVICTSSPCWYFNTSESCYPFFQCANGHLDFTLNFCDGKVDCSDGSDEIGNLPGFKCSILFGRCVLPQRNLYDGVAQCDDRSDLCLDIPCFECLDHRLVVSQSQVCDGIIDCFDLSDECLCEDNFQKAIFNKLFENNDPSSLKCGKTNFKCNSIKESSIETAQCNDGLNETDVEKSLPPLPSRVFFQNKGGDTRAKACDGRPECRDFKDECSCEDPPSFCSDRCHDFYPLGDRYCDGIIDEAWKFINDSSCPEGFDEKSCPQRFTCKAMNLVSIDRVQVCDGKVDCDDGSDEVTCTKPSIASSSVFSSDSEMIESVLLRCIFWFMSLLIIIANSAVIFFTLRITFEKRRGGSQNFNHILIINLSISDLLMGVYLLIISLKSVQYSGFYGDFDYQWRSSLDCSILGSISFISSETSCFIMTILTAFRLYNVFHPFTARTASTLKWKLGIVLAWLVSLVLALLPVFKATSNYFVHEIWFSNQFTSSEGWKKIGIMTFACRLASLTNQSIEANGDAWESNTKYLLINFPEYSPLGEVGYYGETSICMPRIYTSRGDQAWVYSLAIITLNFFSFLFVAFGHIVIFCKTSRRPVQASRSEKLNAKTQKRIARMIATDFACWVPICIIAYLKVGGVEISNVVYTVTAGVLLPINSALNPLLYSPFIEKHLTFYLSKMKRRNTTNTTQ